VLYAVNEFDMSIYSYTDCGGRHDHNTFSLKVNKAVEIAMFLYKYSMMRVVKERETFYAKQEYDIRGELKLSIELNGSLIMEIDSGCLTLDKAQAKKVAGYLFYWAGEKLIGKVELDVPATKQEILDLSDSEQKEITNINNDRWGSRGPDCPTAPGKAWLN
jgi:hypothetical protein